MRDAAAVIANVVGKLDWQDLDDLVTFLGFGTEAVEALKKANDSRANAPATVVASMDWSGENPRRYGRPWIAKVTYWKPGRPAPKIDFCGAFIGDVQSGGRLEIEATPGTFVRFGQKDYRGGNSVSGWGVVESDGSITLVEQEVVLAHFRSSDLR
jgi:hypothetical protein